MFGSVPLIQSVCCLLATLIFPEFFKFFILSKPILKSYLINAIFASPKIHWVIPIRASTAFWRTSFIKLIKGASIFFSVENT